MRNPAILFFFSIMQAAPAVAEPCVGLAFDRPLPGAIDVRMLQTDTRSAQFPGVWQEGIIEGKFYQIFANKVAVLRAERSSTGWSILVDCKQKPCAAVSEKNPPEAAKKISKKLEQCLAPVEAKNDVVPKKPDAVSEKRPKGKAPLSARATPSLKKEGPSKPQSPAIPSSLAMMDIKAPLSARAASSVKKEAPSTPQSPATPNSLAMTNAKAPLSASAVPAVKKEVRSKRQSSAMPSSVAMMNAKTPAASKLPRIAAEGGLLSNTLVSAFAPRAPNVNVQAKEQTATKQKTIALEGYGNVVLAGAPFAATIAPTATRFSRSESGGNTLGGDATELVCLPIRKRGGLAAAPACGQALVPAGSPVETLQHLLVLAGADPGRIDGNYGGRTEKAVLEVLGKLGKDLDVPKAVAAVDAWLCRHEQ